MPNFSQVNLGILNGTSFFQSGSGSLIDIEQVVEFYETASGSLIDLEQIVQVEETLPLITISQIVRDSSQATFFQRNGWYCYLYIGGLRIPDDQISGDITITRTENDAAQMTFTLIPPRGAIDLSLYEGESVFLNIQTADGIFRAYTGLINIPDLDLNKRTLTISCTDNRRELVNTFLSTTVSSIGYYSQNIFGIANDTAQELDYRLTTVPYTLNFDVFGQPRVTYAFAKATADFTFLEDDVYRDSGRDPHVIITPRSKVVNTVNISYEYRYQRLYHKEIAYSWDSDYGGVCEYLKKGYSVCQRSLIEAAISATGWPIRNTVGYTSVPAAGFYRCPTSIGTVAVGLSWTHTDYTTSAATETYTQPDGSTGTRNVVDSNGAQVYNASPTLVTDYSELYCWGASWILSTRWSQNVSEIYSCSVTAPTSASRFGTVSQDETSGTDTQYDSSVWENYTSYLNPPSDVTLYYDAGDTQSYYFNETANYTSYANDMYVLLNKARTTILKSHRENRVIFNTFVFPQIDLHHTALVDCVSHEGTEIYAKGKVYSITHTLKPSNGQCNTQVELALSISSGSVSNTTLSLPTRPSSNIPVVTEAIGLGSHYGMQPSTTWSGFIGNKYITEYTNGFLDTRKTTYPESFVIDTPPIADVYRNNLEVFGSGSYNVNIIDDDLEVII